MQKLIISLFIALMSVTQTSAQGDCQGYPYIIDLDGFVCGNGLGTICFVTSANWVNYSDCKDYVVELEYETGNFIYTDLDDFYLYSQTPDITVLRHKPEFISEGLTIGCLEGVLQVPGTVFTIRVVWPTNPGDILATSTFTLDAHTTIGGPGQTTYLTDAINAQALLPTAQAAGTGQTVVIEGTLVVDQSYEFGISPGGVKNDIIMKPGARIEVGTNNSGFAFGTFYADIHGCDDNWDRILVRPGSLYSGFSTTISDAAVAVELQNQSKLQIGRVLMNNNGIGIASFGTNLKTMVIELYTSIFEGCAIQGGTEGCHFENVDLIDLTGNLRIQHMTTNGIYLDKTDLNGKGLSIYYCPTGINVEKPNDLLTLNHCEIGNGEIGVRSLGTAEMQIDECFFHDLDFGIGRTSGVLGEHTLIENNVIAECGTNVAAIVQASTAEIQFNDLRADQTNVVVWGLDAGAHKWAIQHNTGMFAGLENDNGYNVSFINVRDGRIFRNIEPLSSLYNFAVWGGREVKIDYNKNLISFLDNIRINGSPSGLVSCNETDGNTGLTFLNTCSGTVVRGNDMTGTSFNLSYGTPGNTFASTGPQAYKGNEFDLSSEGNPKAINFSTSTIAQQNQYLVSLFAGPQGSERYPFFTSAFDEWFDSEEFNQEYECPPGITGDDPKDVVLKREITGHIGLLQAGAAASYGAEVGFDIKLKLYRALHELQQIEPLSATNQGWYNTLSGGNFASFVQFEHLFKNAGMLTDAETAVAAQLGQDIRNLKAELKNITWYTLSTELGADPIIIEQRKVLYDSKIAAIKSKSAALSSLLDSHRQNFLNQWNSLNALNNSINTTGTVSAQNLKTANQLLLRRLSANFSGFTETEQQTLNNIANQCFSIGGEGVLTARALLAEITMTLTNYNDECLGGGENRDQAQNSPGLMGLSISPNPVTDVAKIQLPERRNYQSLLIFDLLGRKVQRIELAEGQL
ncbi:MAG: hypothetical protein JNJ57_00280, partial [Saprospiraceae bacterium]|nr:hypothetical protein [Saprospiraceae bacterium]